MTERKEGRIRCVDTTEATRGKHLDLPAREQQPNKMEKVTFYYIILLKNGTANLSGYNSGDMVILFANK
jgi:hypothetical protein